MHAPLHNRVAAAAYTRARETRSSLRVAIQNSGLSASTTNEAGDAPMVGPTVYVSNTLPAEAVERKVERRRSSVLCDSRSDGRGVAERDARGGATAASPGTGRPAARHSRAAALGGFGADMQPPMAQAPLQQTRRQQLHGGQASASTHLVALTAWSLQERFLSNARCRQFDSADSSRLSKCARKNGGKKYLGKIPGAGGGWVQK